MSTGDAFTLTIEGAPSPIVRSFDMVERAHVEARAVVQIHVPLDGEPPNAEQILGAKATLEISPAGRFRDTPRVFHGLVDAVETEPGGARVTIVARVMPLEQGCDHRVFVDLDSLEIAKTLLEEAGLTVEVRASKPAARKQCVQAFESPLAFVLRILSEDGITVWVEQGESEDVVVLADSGAAFTDLPGDKVLPFRPAGDLAGGEAIHAIELASRFTHDGTSVGDYDPDKPTLDLNVSHGETSYPRHAFPGQHRTPEDGKKRAQLLYEQLRRDRTVVRAVTSCRYVAVGFVFEVADAPRDDLRGPFRVIEARHRGQDHDGASDRQERDPRYLADVVAVPMATVIRPPLPRAASLGGLQTMTVTGSSGAEIHTEGQGRIKAHFRWDRLRPMDDTASAWIRPLQPALSGGFLLPRVGWEVLTAFRSEPAADGDAAFELGRMIHGQAPPAESLPGQKVRSNWGTLTTPGGGKQNQLRFDDAAGNEGMLTNASTNFTERTENDKVVIVTANETNTVGGDHQNTVTIQQQTAVTGAQSLTVSGNRELTTVGLFGVSAASELVTVGATRDIKVGGDYETKAATLARVVGAAENVIAIQETNRHVTGASTIVVGGTWTEIGGLTASTGVLGASTLKVDGPMSIKAQNVSINATTLSEKYDGVYKGHAGGKLTGESATVKLKAGGAMKVKGADVLFKASAKIVVKAGGVTITITPSSIKVKGKVKGDSTSVIPAKEEVK